MLASGASPNAVDAEGTPALMAATLFADADMVELLLKRGADPNQTDASGATALMWAVPDVEKVRLLLARGANVNARSQTERTPLLVAAAYPRNRQTCCGCSSMRGADLRAQDRAGTTALALAVRSADVEVVRFLVERGPRSERAVACGAARGLCPLRSADDRLPDVEGTDARRRIVLVTAATWQPAELVARWIELGPT